jgi:hypothetical protein
VVADRFSELCDHTARLLPAMEVDKPGSSQDVPTQKTCTAKAWPCAECGTSYSHRCMIKSLRPQHAEHYNELENLNGAVVIRTKFKKVCVACEVQLRQHEVHCVVPCVCQVLFATLVHSFVTCVGQVFFFVTVIQSNTGTYVMH